MILLISTEDNYCQVEFPDFNSSIVYYNVMYVIITSVCVCVFLWYLTLCKEVHNLITNYYNMVEDFHIMYPRPWHSFICGRYSVDPT